MRHYNSIAREEEIPAKVDQMPGSAVLVVHVPMRASREEIFATLDHALQLVEQARESVTNQATSLSRTEDAISEWWRLQTLGRQG
jgi:hypothetical protein